MKKEEEYKVHKYSDTGDPKTVIPVSFGDLISDPAPEEKAPVRHPKKEDEDTLSDVRCIPGKGEAKKTAAAPDSTAPVPERIAPVTEKIAGSDPVSDPEMTWNTSDPVSAENRRSDSVSDPGVNAPSESFVVSDPEPAAMSDSVSDPENVPNTGSAASGSEETTGSGNNAPEQTADPLIENPFEDFDPFAGKDPGDHRPDGPAKSRISEPVIKRYSDARPTDDKKPVDEKSPSYTNYAGRYNNRVAAENRVKRYIADPAAKGLEKIGQAVEDTVAEKDEGAQNVAEVASYGELLVGVGENSADKNEAKRILRRGQDNTYGLSGRTGSYLRAGNVFSTPEYKELGVLLKRDYGIVDPKQLTYGDIRMFGHLSEHQELINDETGKVDMTELLKIREETNTSLPDGGSIHYEHLGINNGLRKKADAIVRSSRINAVEIRAVELMKNGKIQFSAAEKAVLNTPDGLIIAGSRDDIAVRMSILTKIWDSEASSSEFAGIRIDQLNAKQTKRLLKDIRQKRETSGTERLTMILETMLGLERTVRESENHRNRARRQSVTGFAAGKFLQEMNRDEDFAGMSEVASTGTKGVTTTVDIAKGTVKLSVEAPKALRTEAEKLARAHYVATDQTQKVAELDEKIAARETAVQAKRKKKQDRKDRVSGAFRSVLIDPWAKRLKSTGDGRIGRMLFGDKEYARKAGESVLVAGARKNGILGSVRNVVLAPFRGISAATTFLRKKVIAPVLISCGGILVMMVIVLMFSGGSAAPGSSAVLILDSPEHFTNPGYTDPDEMGFQEKYDSCQDAYNGKVSAIVNGKASTLNKKGEQIGYGVNVVENEEKGITAQHRNGVTYSYDNANSDNLYDLVTAVAVLMQQDQEAHHPEALELLEALYNSTHTYDYAESILYACDGCDQVTFRCSDYKTGFTSEDTELRHFRGSLSGWVKNTDEIERLTETVRECEVCAQLAGDEEKPDYGSFSGCEVLRNENGDPIPCYHGTEEDINNRTYEHVIDEEMTDPDNAGQTCSNWRKVLVCGKEEHEHTDSCYEPDNDPSCGNTDPEHVHTSSCYDEHLDCGKSEHTHDESCYIYVCAGHNHYYCPGEHKATVCFGHTDLTMNIHMKSLPEIFELGGVVPDDGGNAAISDLDEYYSDYDKVLNGEMDENDFNQKWHSR